jgi:hypothetical protein
VAEKREVLTLDTRIAIVGQYMDWRLGNCLWVGISTVTSFRMVMYVWLADESAKVNIEIVIFTLM